MDQKKQSQPAPAVTRIDSDSGVSLEYSMDSSMMDHSTFLKDGDSSALATQPADNLPEGVPSDEALFKVGWAKALDQKSGSYYYFTLDRTKIVWDNPLSPRGDASVESDTLPTGQYVI
jgi:hypothetical protein